MKGKPHVPRFYCFGEWGHGVYMEMQIMVRDLSGFVEKSFTAD